MQEQRKNVVSEIMITYHAVNRWAERINLGEKLTPEDISKLLKHSIIGKRIKWLDPKGYGIFCWDDEIIF